MAAPEDGLMRTPLAKRGPSLLLPVDSITEHAVDSSSGVCCACCRRQRRATRLSWAAALSLALLVGVAVAPRLLSRAHLVVRFREQHPPLSGLGGVYHRRPVTFKRRISSLYLASDIDPLTQNNLGLPGCNTPTVFFSPDCDGSHNCDIEGAPGDYSGRRARHLVRSWFDFLRREEEMDAELNSHEVMLCPGTYRYVRIEWTKHAGDCIANCDGYDGQRLQLRGAEDQPCPFTHMWQADSMTRPFYSTGGGSVTTIKLDDPVEVSWGSYTRFEIELHFSLMDAIVQDPSECYRKSVGNDNEQEMFSSACLCAVDAGNARSLDTDESILVREPTGPCLRPPRFRATVIRIGGEGL